MKISGGFAMGNLGLYQSMTTAAKKVGGPVRLLLIVAGGGYVVFRGAEVGIKKIVSIAKRKKGDKTDIVMDKEIIYKVTADGIEQNRLEFHIGDKFRILETDDDAVLIEKFGTDNNPYFVSGDFLKTVSEYKAEIHSHRI